MLSSEIEYYDILRAKIGDREAQAFLSLLEKRIETKFEEKKDELLTIKDKDALITKEFALTVFATKADLERGFKENLKWTVATLIAVAGFIIAAHKLL